MAAAGVSGVNAAAVLEAFLFASELPVILRIFPSAEIDSSTSST